MGIRAIHGDAEDVAVLKKPGSSTPSTSSQPQTRITPICCRYGADA
jgi:hypothetical protein